MDKQLKRSSDRELKGCSHDIKFEKWFYRALIVVLIIMTALLIVTGIQHIWLTQSIINEMAS